MKQAKVHWAHPFHRVWSSPRSLAPLVSASFSPRLLQPPSSLGRKSSHRGSRAERCTEVFTFLRFAIKTFHNKSCHLRCLVLRLIIFVAQVQSCLVLDLRFDETECCQHLPIQPHYDQDKWVDDDDGSESSSQPKRWLSAQAERAARSSLSINTTAAPSSLPSSTASSPSPVPATGESQLGPDASNDRPDYVEISILLFCVNVRSMMKKSSTILFTDSMSSTARLILDTLDKMSTPIQVGRLGYQIKMNHF